MSKAIADMSFEEALAELDTLVRQLESGTTKLDESIAAYERGTALKLHCESKLKEAQARVEAIVLSPDGAVTTRPVDIA